jgi:lipopolysaccharide biosynthesis regulator YciM
MEYAHNWWILSVIIILVVFILLFWSKSKKVKSKPADKLYIEGLKALLAGDDSKAFQRLKQVVSQDTNNVDAYLKLGDIFRKKKRPDKALQIHSNLTLRPDLAEEIQMEIKKSLALDYIESGEHSQAISILKDMVKSNQTEFWAGSKLISEYEETGNWEEAFELRARLSKGKKEKNQQILALYKVFIGNQLASKGDYHKARLAYKEALNCDEKCVPAYIFLGEAYHSDERLEEAAESWRKLAEKVPQSAYLVFEKLEKVLFEMGNFGEIEKFYNQILSADPKNTHALLALATLDEKRGKTEQAQERYSLILDIDPLYLPAQLSLLRICQDKGQTYEAKHIIEGLFDICPSPLGSFICQKCGHNSDEPLWRCPRCKSWNSFNI